MLSTYIEFSGLGKVEVHTEEVTTDGLRPMEVLIQNETSIISAGTELARLHGLDEDVTFPYRPGYGSIGKVVAKGSGITDFQVGDRVFYAGKHASVQRFTHGADHQWGYLFPVPPHLDAVLAAVGCMVQISMTAPRITDVRLGDKVVVFGLGTVGVLSALLYQLKGATVAGADPVKSRCDLARHLGIETVFDVPPSEQVQAIREWTGGAARRSLSTRSVTPPWFAPLFSRLHSLVKSCCWVPRALHSQVT